MLFCHVTLSPSHEEIKIKSLSLSLGGLVTGSTNRVRQKWHCVTYEAGPYFYDDAASSLFTGTFRFGALSYPVRSPNALRSPYCEESKVHGKATCVNYSRHFWTSNQCNPGARHIVKKLAVDSRPFH